MNAPESGVVWLCRLGSRAYEEVWALQKQLITARRRREIPDLVLAVEHPHVITAGRGTRPENLRGLEAPDGSGHVPLFEIERGGDVTYHGPGQLVAYFLFDLESGGRDLHRFLRQVEGVQIELASGYGVTGERKAGKTGVWVGEKKIGSVGIAVRRWVTYHGFALNACTDLNFFRLINPCGFDASVMSSLSELTGRSVRVAELEDRLPAALEKVFGRPVVKVGEKRLPGAAPAAADATEGVR